MDATTLADAQDRYDDQFICPQCDEPLDDEGCCHNDECSYGCPWDQSDNWEP